MILREYLKKKKNEKGKNLCLQPSETKEMIFFFTCSPDPYYASYVTDSKQLNQVDQSGPEDEE